MDEKEKQVLIQKEYLLITYLRWNLTLEEALSHELVLGEEALTKVQKAKGPSSKIKVLLDYMRTRGCVNFVDKLASTLEYTRSSFIPDWSNVWISDELREELKAERDQLKITPEVSYEAGQLVHKQFGHGKKLAEFDKRKCTKMISRTTQCTNNIWEAQTSRTIEDVAAERDLFNSKRDLCVQMIHKLTSFLQANRERVIDEGKHKKNLGGSTTSAFTQPAPSDDQPETVDLEDIEQPAPLVEDAVNKVIKLLGQSMLHTELLDGERMRVFEMVGVTKSSDTRLHGELEEAIKKKIAELRQAEEATRRKKQRYQEVLVDLEEEKKTQRKLMRAVDKNVSMMLAEYQRVKGRIYDGQDGTEELREEVKLARAENKLIRERYGFIENGSRLNTIVRRDSQKAGTRNSIKISQSIPEDLEEHTEEPELLEYQPTLFREEALKNKAPTKSSSSLNPQRSENAPRSINARYSTRGLDSAGSQDSSSRSSTRGSLVLSRQSESQRIQAQLPRQPSQPWRQTANNPTTSRGRFS